MPHPFLLIAGVVIFIGTGILLVNEYQQFKAEEEFNRIRFQPKRITLKRNHRKQETDDEEEEEEAEIEKNLSPSCYQTFRIDPFKDHQSNHQDPIPFTLRNRFQTNQNPNQYQKSKVFPLIDFSEQDEPFEFNQSVTSSNPFESNQTVSTKDQSDIPLKEIPRNINQENSTSSPTSLALASHGQGNPFDDEQEFLHWEGGSSHTEEKFSKHEDSSSHGEELPSQIPEPEMSMEPVESNDSNHSTKPIENETNSDQSSSKPAQSVSSRISFDELESNQSDESSNWLEVETHDSTDEFELM